MKKKTSAGEDSWENKEFPGVDFLLPDLLREIKLLAALPDEEFCCYDDINK